MTGCKSICDSQILERERRKEMNLPKSFVSIAGKYGIKKEDIVFAAMADFDMVGNIPCDTKVKIL